MGKPVAVETYVDHEEGYYSVEFTDAKGFMVAEVLISPQGGILESYVYHKKDMVDSSAIAIDME